MFNSIDDRLWGVSYLQMIYTGFFNVYQLAIMTYAAAFFYKSFSKEAPWFKIDSSSPAFFDMKSEFYPEYSLNTDSGTGSVIGPLVACLFVCICLVLASVYKGIDLQSRLALVFSLLIIIILIVVISEILKTEVG